MSENDFTMTVGEFVELTDKDLRVFVVNTAQITVIAQEGSTWRVRLIDGTNFLLEGRVAHAFMDRLTGMPGSIKLSPLATDKSV